MTTVQMIPPSNGSLDSITVNGRTYTSLPSMAIAVQSFDVPALQANGWQLIQSNPLAGGSGETWAGRLRRLAVNAKGKNPIESPRLMGAKPWVVSGGAWTGNTAYTFGQFRSNNGLLYVCVVAGTSAASGGPTGNSPNTYVTDGTAQWLYYMGTVGDVVSNGGIAFRLTTAGTPDTSGTGPSGYGGIDGTGGLTWAAIGPQTAPVLNFAGSHNSAYSTTVSIGAANYVNGAPPIRWRGGEPVYNSGLASTGIMSVDFSPSPGNLGLSAPNAGKTAIYQSMSFVIEGASLELTYIAVGTAPPSIIVDGQYCDWQLPIGDTFQYNSLVIDFSNVYAQTGNVAAPGRGRHTITIESTGGNFYIANIRLKPTDKLYYPDVTDDFSVALITDSQGSGGNNQPIIDSYGVQLMHLLGLPDMVIAGIGGTGVVNPGASTPYAGHVFTDLALLYAFRPIGMIILQPSQNDNAYTSTLQAATLSLIQSLRSAYPSVPIFVTGCWVNVNSGLANAKTIENLTFAAVAQQQSSGDNLIFTIPIATDPNGPLFFGTGYIGNTTGTGNTDFNTSNDGVHMSPAGSALWAQHLAINILRIIAGIP